MMILTARAITKCYGSQVVALDATSLAIGRGEYVAVVGPSGSGKSTLMNILGLLDRPSAGHLLLGGVDCVALNDDQRAMVRNRHIGFVFQAYHLLPRLTALRNVELPLIYAGLPRRQRLWRASRALEAVGLGSKQGRVPTELSGGEQQRVAIARAIVANPSIILADEPTGALDTASSAGIMDLLASLHGAGRTIILVTHDPGIAARASRIVSMRDGRIVADRPSRAAAQPMQEAAA